MSKITSYKVVKSKLEKADSEYVDKHGLKRKVQESIKKGWQPHGAPQINDYTIIQAMVKTGNK